jgi:hypothetical protein
MHRRA